MPSESRSCENISVHQMHSGERRLRSKQFLVDSSATLSCSLLQSLMLKCQSGGTSYGWEDDHMISPEIADEQSEGAEVA